jgi:hypothetical protein
MNLASPEQAPNRELIISTEAKEEDSRILRNGQKERGRISVIRSGPISHSRWKVIA